MKRKPDKSSGFHMVVMLAVYSVIRLWAFLPRIAGVRPTFLWSFLVRVNMCRRPHQGLPKQQGRGLIPDDPAT